MYNSKIVNQRVAALLKTKSFNQKQLLESCELNVNLLNKMTDNKGIGCFALARIADRLETTTDYLLGRSDKSDMNTTITQTGGFIESSPISVVNAPEKTAPVKELDEMTIELVKAFKALSFKDKMEIMNAVMKKSQK